MTAPALIESIRGVLERTYGMSTGIVDLAPYVIGDEGYRILYAATDAPAIAAESPGGGAKTLVRETEDGVRACIYYPDALIRHLEAHPPQRGVADRNVDAFAIFVEELDHLLCIADRTRGGPPLTLFELELHANVSKYLVLQRFAAASTASRREHRRVWLRWHLFHKGEWVDDQPAAAARYRDAARWALRFLDGLEEIGTSGPRIEALRRFHDADASGKRKLIRDLAA